MSLYTVLLTVLSFTLLTTNALRPLQESKILPSIRADYEKYRLPGESAPSAYTVILKVDPNKQDSFEGQVTITTSPTKATNELVLHSNVASLSSITVTDENGDDLYSEHTLAGDDTYFLRITTTKELVQGETYTIDIDFIANYGKNLAGLYLSTYKDANGNDRYLAVTQFESTNARDAFPCYDEPGFKATFQVNIYVPDGYHALCNTDVAVETDLPEIEGMTLFAFDRTVKMSSYLVAFVISDFEHVSNLDANEQYFSKKVRIYAKPGSENDLEFALEYGQKTIAELEKFTDVTYALSKLDHVAIPDFSAGAMENWGLVTYREPYLIYEPEEQTTRQLQSIATVIAHENGHMYFGNEVSPKWWDYLWLSEGFASYFEYYLPNVIDPTWRLMEEYVIDNLFSAMPFDSRPQTNPMTSSVASPGEISNNFNTIAYQKSGSVIRMVEHILGSSNFRQGLSNYLKSIPLGLGEPSLLFEGLRKASEGLDIFPEGISIVDVFENWSTQAGFPVVIAQKTFDRKNAVIRQRRYYEDTTLSSDETWWVPINWATSLSNDFSDTSPQAWLAPNEEHIVIPIDLNDENDWFIVNKQVTGYFRIMYDEENWNSLAKALSSPDFDGINVLNRLQLVNDAMEYARTLKMSYRIAFDVMFYMRNELDFMPWLSIYSGLTTLNYLMPGSENYDLYREFLQMISNKAFNDLTLDVNEDDEYTRKMNRNYVTNVACNAGNQACWDDANKKLADVMEDPSIKFHPDVRSIIYCSGMRQASEDMWNFFWDKYTTSTSGSEKTAILRGLGCSEDVAILENYLKMTISSDNDLDGGVKYSIIESVINSGITGVDQALHFITGNFEEIQANMASNTVRIINAIRGRIVTREHATEFSRFALTYDKFTSGEKIAVDSALTLINSNRQWLDIVLVDIDAWLLANIARTI